MSLLRVCVVQQDVRLGDREGSFARLEALLAEKWQCSETATAVILPELWDVGYVIDAPGFCGDPETWQAARFLGDLARKYNCWFVGGSVFAVTDEGAFNRAMVVNPSGEYVAHYDKAHLISLMDENKYLRAGDKRVRVNIGGAECGMAICYDLRFCEWTRLYALEGAEVLFISAEWPQERIEHWSALLRARAIENMTYVVACNRVGESNGTTFGGRSAVIDPWGRVLWEGGSGEELAFVEFDTAEAAKARNFLKVFQSRRPELYREL